MTTCSRDDVLDGYVSFFADQIGEIMGEYGRMLKTPVKQLVVAGMVHYAVVHGVSAEKGHVILKLDKKSTVRLKVGKSFVLIKRAARELWGENPAFWNCSLEEFLRKDEYSTSSSTVLPLYYLKGHAEGTALVGCGSIGMRMFNKIQNALSDGIKLHVLLYDTEPPVRYLANLAGYIRANPADGILKSVPHISYDEWKPVPLAYRPEKPHGIADELLRTLGIRKRVVLQGPPGTGKSFAAAQVIADYLDKGKTVCVAAMANKALMELILHPPLSDHLNGGRLCKTMLTSDEALSAKGLKGADADYIASKGEALFATYYKISDRFHGINNGAPKSFYDLVVVEEASQAYLTTIAALLRMGSEALIVGDPMQLPPIVVSDGKPEYRRWNADNQADGLLAYALGNSVCSFRITTTFRLTPASALLTGLFYGGELRSVAPKRIDWGHADEYFPPEGGVILKISNAAENGVLSSDAMSVIEAVLGKIKMTSAGASVAIITPFRDSAKAIQRHVVHDGADVCVSVETIDRMQGATVDYAILYFPMRNAAFALSERRFNVATSRSRSTTLILSDCDLLEMRSACGKVRQFLEGAKRVCDETPLCRNGGLQGIRGD